MEQTASIGALRFRFRRLIVAPAPGTEALTPLGLVDGLALARLESPAGTFLVVDHRALPAGGRPCRVEWWEVVSGGEGRLVGLLVLADLRHQRPRSAAGGLAAA